MVHAVLLQTGFAPERLELEITESVLAGDFDQAISILRRLKALGVRIAMDDFGTGYSSLSYLHQFPFDRLKIDRSFIMSLGQNAPASAIVRAVIGLAKGLSLPVTAEGVETKEQLEFLAREHCDEVQGYLIGRPGPIDAYGDITGAGRAYRALTASKQTTRSGSNLGGSPTSPRILHRHTQCIDEVSTTPPRKVTFPKGFLEVTRIGCCP
jgi:EAL domain-containing protein (putative c-di-GMP-specific phosphodiesterase class I)